jgi:phosphoribosylglycinamide formyltransferase 1
MSVPPATKTDRRVATAILASGDGSNLEAVITAAREGILPLDIKLVISNKSHARALQRAARAGIPSRAVPFDRAREDRGAYARRLAAAIQESGATLVLLLGWMHVLAPEFLRAGFEGVLNLHPAYLPEDPAADSVEFPDGVRTPVFRGAHALRDALAAGVPCTGATLMQITEAVDRGPVLARKPLRLVKGEDEAAALERLHALEREVVREGVLTWLKARTPA